MSSTLRTTRGLGIALVLVGLGAPIRAGGDDAERPRLAAISWASRERGGSERLIDLPPVADQRDSFTCVAWAIRTVAAFHRRRMEPRSGAETRPLDPEVWSRDFVPSVAYYHNQEIRRLACARPDGTGSGCEPAEELKPRVLTPNVHMVFTSLTSFGAPTEQTSPFTTNVAAVPTTTQREIAEQLRCCWQTSLGRALPPPLEGEAITEATLRAGLERGPLIAMMNVFTDFACDGGDVYRPLDSTTKEVKSRGRHALVIVGYDPGPGADRPAFQFMNSWGDGWRDRGMVWIPFSAFGSHPDTETPVIWHVWLPEPPKDVPVRPPGTQACGDCGRPLVTPPVIFFGPPQNEGQTWHAAGPPLPCGDVPVMRVKAPDPSSSPDSDKPGVTSGPLVAAEPVSVPRKKGEIRTLRAPPIPLIPALFDAKIRYFVGPEADARKKGGRRPEEILKPIDRDLLGYDFRFVGLGEDKRPNSQIGPDPDAIGAWQDRAQFEITDESLISSEPILVHIEVSYPGDDAKAYPRLVGEYVITVAPPAK